MIGSAVSVSAQYRRATEGQTDGPTDKQTTRTPPHMPRAAKSRRASYLFDHILPNTYRKLRKYVGKRGNETVRQQQNSRTDKPDYTQVGGCVLFMAVLRLPTQLPCRQPSQSKLTVYRCFNVQPRHVPADPTAAGDGRTFANTYWYNIIPARYR